MKKSILIIILVFLGIFYLMADPKPPRFGIGLKGAGFGMPDVILDKFIYEHPKISGSSYGFELRTFGEKGTKSLFSGLFSFEYSKMTGDGYWRVDQVDQRKRGQGKAEQIMATATIIMSIFPSSPVHPFIGAGIGVGRVSYWAEGTYVDDVGTEIRETHEDERLIPVGHVPIGVIVNIGTRMEIRIEGGFKNGFYFGGSLSVIL